MNSLLIFNMPLLKLYTDSSMLTLNARNDAKLMTVGYLMTPGNVQPAEISGFKIAPPSRAEVCRVIWI